MPDVPPLSQQILGDRVPEFGGPFECDDEFLTHDSPPVTSGFLGSGVSKATTPGESLLIISIAWEIPTRLVAPEMLFDGQLRPE